MAATIEDARRLALALPDVTEGICYGTPAFYLRGKLVLRLRDDLETLVVKVPFERREELLAMEPDIFSLTDHYLKYPAILVTLTNVGVTRLRELIEGAWEMLASKRQMAARTQGHKVPSKSGSNL